MKQLSSAEFRKAYTAQTEPVEVTAYGKLMGTWYPAGAEIPAPTTDAEYQHEPEHFDAPAPRMTIRPAKGPRKEMVAKEQRVLDPLDIRRRRDEAYRMLAQTQGQKRR